MNNCSTPMEVQIRIDHDEMVEEAESHTFDDLQDRYRRWIRQPILGRNGTSWVTFEGATFTAQLERTPTPRARVALIDNDGPQPLISGDWVEECRPMPADWSPDELGGGLSSMYGYQVTYKATNQGEKREELARSHLDNDIEPRCRYEVRDTRIEEDGVIFTVYVPGADTGSLSVPRRLFPTAHDITSLGSDTGAEGDAQ